MCDFKVSLMSPKLRLIRWMLSRRWRLNSWKSRVEAGPALRQANYVETGPEHSASLRAAEYFTWAFAPRNQLRQSLVAYWEGGNSTVIGSTALTTTLYEALAARASFEVRYESQPPRDRENTDTTTRLTLVYSF